MSSVVYYKFKSQKEPSHVKFDGTGISVFDLKREILIANKLTANAETFDLQIINPDTKEEYKDDTEVIPRSVSVTARRLPGAYPGASRYVSGTAAGSRRGPGAGRGGHSQAPKPTVPTTSAPAIQNAPAGSEEEMISAMFQNQSEVWQQTQQHMSQQQFVSNRTANNNSVNVPDHPPPSNYTCYRCGQKGHWIQVCPTNNDPNWDGKRVKRTTGIPKTMLKTVQKPTDGDDPGNSTYLVNDDGDFVQAVADDASWLNYQAKTKAQTAKVQDERPTDPELECPLTHKLFVNPVQTPCCKKTYSKDAIESRLLESDFKCPNCDQEEVLLDQLVEDKEMQKRVDEYMESKLPDGKKRKRSGDDDGENGSENGSSEVDGNENSEKKRKTGSEGGSDTEEAASSNNTAAAAMPGNMPMPMPWMMPGMPGMPPPPMMMPGMPPMPPFMPPFMPVAQQQQKHQTQQKPQQKK